jgi:hypothetical protein
VAASKAEESLPRRRERGQVEVKREDQILRDRSRPSEEIYLGTEVIATAVGRPRMRA